MSRSGKRKSRRQAAKWSAHDTRRMSRYVDPQPVTVRHPDGRVETVPAEHFERGKKR